MGRGRRNYEQVRTQPEESIPTAEGIVPSSPSPSDEECGTTRLAAASHSTALLAEEQGPGHSNEPEQDDENAITVVILDVAQKKFPVKISPHSTVQRLKQKGTAVHKVPPDRQRLIFHGRMLQDERTLAEEKVTDEMIVHLFPKPRVLIQDTHGKSISRGNSTEAESSAEGGTTTDDEGARVPTIIMNADEAQQRSQILVLGSADYLEAANNVRLFSFMLLIISVIELMNLLGVALGVPQEDPSAAYDYDSGDDIFPRDDDNNNNGAMSNTTVVPGAGSQMTPHWNLANTFDTIISVMGVYVAIIGLKATTINTLRLARLYLTGTFLTGVGWCLFNYVMTYEIDKELEKNHEQSRDDLPSMTDSDLAWQAMSVMVLPCMVWMLCCLRAWQFQYLLREAEQEAEERIRSELANIRGDPSVHNDEEEAVLPVENGTMS